MYGHFLTNRKMIFSKNLKNSIKSFFCLTIYVLIFLVDLLHTNLKTVYLKKYKKICTLHKIAVRSRNYSSRNY